MKRAGSNKEVTYEQWKKDPFPIHAKDLFRNMPLEIFIEDWWTIESTEEETMGQQVPFVLWPKQREMCRWIELTKIGFTGKARQRGGSEIFAAYAGKILLSEEGSEILFFSRMEDDAKYLLEKRLVRKLKALPHPTNRLEEEIVIWPTITYGTFEVKTSYGSSISALSSHPDAGSGHTARLVLLDEAEKIEDAKGIWLAVKPTVDQNKRGQLFAISTGQKHGTWFKGYLKKLYEGVVKGIGLFFLPWNADPTKDEAWYANELSQFDSEVDMRCTYPSCIEDIFLSKEGKVFPQYDDKEGGRHVYDFELRLKQGQLWGMDMYCAYDPGFSPHPAAFLVCLYDRYTDILYVYDEIVLVGVEIHKMGALIKNKVSGLPVRPKKCVVDTYGNRKGGTGGLVTETTVLNQISGLRFTSANKADAGGSRELLSKRFSENRIVIHPRCFKTRTQLQDWVWAENGRPVDEGDDTIDDLRYICQELRPQKAPAKAAAVEAYSQEAKRMKAKAGKFLLRAMGGESGASENYHWQGG